MDELLTKPMMLEYEEKKSEVISTQLFTDQSDATIEVRVQETEAFEDPVALIKMLFSYGMFDLCVEHHNGDNDKILLGISARQRQDGEINMLIKALRFVADTLAASHPPYEIDYSK